MAPGFNTSTTWLDTTSALYQDTAEPRVGMRLTVAADGNIWITGPAQLPGRIRAGPDENFSEPTPGDPTGSSADDQIDVQNVLGIVSWATGTPNDGGVRLSSVLNGNCTPTPWSSWPI